MKKLPNLTKPIKAVFRVLDAVLFSLLLLLPLQSLRKRPPLYIAAFCAVLTAVLLIRKAAEARKRMRERAREEERSAVERLLLSDDVTLKEAAGDPGFVLIRRLSPDIADVACAVLQGATSLGLLAISPQVRAFLDRNAPDCAVFDRTALLSLFDPGAKPAQKPRRRIASGVPINKYAALGCLLLIASFWVRYKIYYRLAAGLCLFLYTLSGVLRRNKFFGKMYGDS